MNIGARILTAASLFVGLLLHDSATAQTLSSEGIPRYSHIFVIVDENKGYGRIMNPKVAPNIYGYASNYGNATQFYGEVHPSEANYVAIISGDTFGIHDDDPFFCEPGMPVSICPSTKRYKDYASHSRSEPHIGERLLPGQTWKGYFESLPVQDRAAVKASDPKFVGSHTAKVYASKHTGFLNFERVAKGREVLSPNIVSFEDLYADLDSGSLPSFALVVPNLCNDMHGVAAINLPADCGPLNTAGLIRRGDRMIGGLVERIKNTKAWNSSENVAVVVTFDEDDRHGPQDAPSNFRGGHIPTVVIANHVPHREDNTAYSHYSLLRTIEDALGIPEHLGHANDRESLPMTPLFSPEWTPKD